jgi:phosphoglycerate dehydrogenase-like enzyme
MAAGAEPAVLADALARADVLSLHAPALPETRHMIGAAELALLRPGATLINTARGSLVDTAALERACVTGRHPLHERIPVGPIPAGVR